MKTKYLLLTGALLLASSTFTFAQDASADKPADKAEKGEKGPGGPRGQGRPQMGSPIVGAIDANHDGVISAEEIANASAALKALDKNGDGQLTGDEIHPARPEGRGPKDGKGPRGPRPDGDKAGPPPEGGDMGPPADAK